MACATHEINDDCKQEIVVESYGCIGSVSSSGGSDASGNDKPQPILSTCLSQAMPLLTLPTSRKMRGKEKKNKLSSPESALDRDHHQKHKKPSCVKRERESSPLILTAPVELKEQRRLSQEYEYLSLQPPAKKSKKRNTDTTSTSDKQPLPFSQNITLDNSAINNRYRVALGRVGGTWYLLNTFDHRLIRDALHQELLANRSEDFSFKQEKHMKEKVKFIGVKSESIAPIFTQFHSQYLKHLSPAQQVYVAYKLIESEFREEKHVGILTLNKVFLLLLILDKFRIYIFCVKTMCPT